jgi:hypothetical protein
MKIIDLLNKIANGEEVPTIILFNSYKYRFDKIDRVYRNIRGNSTLGEINELDLYLNDEVEIIKEDKKIEKLDKQIDITKFANEYKEVAQCLTNFSNKINEIIDYINKGDK